MDFMSSWGGCGNHKSSQLSAFRLYESMEKRERRVVLPPFLLYVRGIYYPTDRYVLMWNLISELVEHLCAEVFLRSVGEDHHNVSFVYLFCGF